MSLMWEWWYLGFSATSVIRLIPLDESFHFSHVVFYKWESDTRKFWNCHPAGRTCQCVHSGQRSWASPKTMGQCVAHTHPDPASLTSDLCTGPVSGPATWAGKRSEPKSPDFIATCLANLKNFPPGVLQFLSFSFCLSNLYSQFCLLFTHFMPVQPIEENKNKPQILVTFAIIVSLKESEKGYCWWKLLAFLITYLSSMLPCSASINF